MGKIEPWDREFSVRSFTPRVGVGALSHLGEPYSAGYVACRHGVVGFYTQAGRSPHTSIIVVRDGTAFERNWSRTFTERSLKTVANRFAAEIAEVDRV